MEFKDAVKAALDIHRDEAKDLADTWKNLDGKAQGVNTISGVFLAALFAWSKDGVPTCDKTFYVAAVACLLFAVITAILAMRVKMIGTSATAAVCFESIELIFAKPVAERNERALGFFTDFLRASVPSNDEVRGALESKGRFLLAGQILVVAAIVLFSIIVLRRILGAG